MTDSEARLISIAGHPAVLMPGAAMIASAGASRASSVLAVSLAVACGLLVLAYGYYKARSGHWAHIDASAPDERAELNTRFGVALLVIAAALGVGNVHIVVVAAVALSGLVVLAAHLVRGTAKPSLHVAFAVFAALIVWPQYLASAILVLIAIAVGWSRIILRRHAGPDLAWGAALGVLAGFGFQAVRTLIDG